jgi:hypothetical protein
MAERTTKHSGMSFLDKFEGKTSKMGKQGITALIEVGSKPSTIPTTSTTSNSKRPSGKQQAILVYRDTKPLTYDMVQSKHSYEVSLDAIIPTHPDRTVPIGMKLPPKQPTDRRIASISKNEYVPSFGGDESSRNTKTKTLTTLDRTPPLPSPTKLTIDYKAIGDKRYQSTNPNSSGNRTTEMSRIRHLPSY